MKIEAEELIIKMIDSDTQKIKTEKWNLKDLL